MRLIKLSPLSLSLTPSLTPSLCLTSDICDYVCGIFLYLWLFTLPLTSYSSALEKYRKESNRWTSFKSFPGLRDSHQCCQFIAQSAAQGLFYKGMSPVILSIMFDVSLSVFLDMWPHCDPMWYVTFLWPISLSLCLVRSCSYSGVLFLWPHYQELGYEEAECGYSPSALCWLCSIQWWVLSLALAWVNVIMPPDDLSEKLKLLARLSTSLL